MKLFQKNQIIKLITKWILIFILISTVFFSYQKKLGDAYEAQVISWIGSLESKTDLKTAVFHSFDKASYNRGLQAIQNSGYGETGKKYLHQVIASFGRTFFFTGIFLICSAGALFEYHTRKKEEKQHTLMLEKERNRIYTQIQSEKEFIQAERQKMGIYMENISHQLKTPIAGTLLNLEYLLDTESDSEKKERLEGCVKQLSKMSEMTIVLLRLAQIDSGKIWMNRKRENLSLLIEDCIDRIQPLTEEKHLSLQREINENYIFSCDAFWIKEAIENILKNAVEFTPENGLIQVSLKQVNDYYEICIFNSGRKLDKKYHELIFERFYQMETKNSNSFGIGLHLAREITALHQGTLRVLDTNKGGTTFQFLFPKMISKDHSGQNLTILKD